MLLKTRSHTHFEELCIFLYWLLLGQIKQKGIKATTRSILRAYLRKIYAPPRVWALTRFPPAIHCSVAFPEVRKLAHQSTGHLVHAPDRWCTHLHRETHSPPAVPSEAMSEWWCAPQAPDSRTYSHCSMSKPHNVGYWCFWSNVKEKAIWMESNSRHLMCSVRLSYSIMPQDCKPSKRCFFTWLPCYSRKCYGKQPQNCPFES